MIGLYSLLAIIVGAAAGHFALWPLAHRARARKIEEGVKERAKIELDSAEASAKGIVADAREEAQQKLNAAHQDAKRLEKDLKNKERSLYRQEERLQQNQDRLEKKISQADRTNENISRKEKKIDEKLSEAEAMIEKAAEISREEARELVLVKAREESEHDIARMVKDIEHEARRDADSKARLILIEAMQRTTVDHYSEAIITTVELKNDDMKGRIIGREGRNIRSIEAATGVDVIVDDTPGVVVLSCFDPVRREIGRESLERLLKDGRIHPAKIEEIVEKVTSEMDDIIWEAGQEACFQTGITGLNPELIKTLGKLKFRTSYGQNVLKHVIEVAHLAGVIAAELGIKLRNAKRGGLLHDIGKAIMAEVEGSHPEIGMELARRCGENKTVCNVIGAHHGDIEQTLEAAIVQVADSLSASRPGARGEALESYVKRLTKLEEVAKRFAGVQKAFAIQAGRELRVLVSPKVVDDILSWDLCRKISRQIEKELEYPGMIKVTVIRETREIEYAR